MKVRASWEFDVDVSDFDPMFVDIPGLAKDLTKNELAYLIAHGELSFDDFEYSIVKGKKSWDKYTKPETKQEPIFVKYDRVTRAWFNKHPDAQTTVMCCEHCGLWYKPILGHNCRKEKDNENQ